MDLAVPQTRVRAASIGGEKPAMAQSDPTLTAEAKRRSVRLDEIGVEAPGASMPQLEVELKGKGAKKAKKKKAREDELKESGEDSEEASEKDQVEVEQQVNLEEPGEPAYLATGGHIFHKSTFNSPTHCTACKGFIWGIRKQGSSCEVCCAPVHDRCRDDLAMACYEARHVEVAGKDVVTFEHHWLPGNLQLASSHRCVVCSKSCKNSMSKSFHCARCKRAVHTKNCKEDAVVCTPPLRQLLFSTELLSRDFPGYTPLLVFVNTKSGGQQGFQVLRRMRRLLTNMQVVDMFAEEPVGPLSALTKYAGVPNLRVLVCGGDGTAGWVLGVMDKIEAFKDNNPPIAVLPLGTGNDLARVLGWGGGYGGDPVSPILASIEEAKPVPMDRWKIKITEHTGKVQEFVFNNYFSIGIDAKIALKFHKMRQSNPDLFKSRLVNKGVYGTFGIQNAVSKAETMKDLEVKLVVDQEATDIDLTLEGLVLLNIQSYAAGTDLWGKVSTEEAEQGKWQPGQMHDQKLEVVGMRGVTHMIGMQAGLLGGERIAQGAEVVITGAAMDVQVDGEPMHLEECTISVSFFNKMDMLLGE